MLARLSQRREVGAKPADRFERPEWRVSAKADAYIKDAERLEVVDCCRNHDRPFVGQN